MNPAGTVPTAGQALELRDVHLPPPPGWWPPAPGWWVVAALLLALLTTAGIWLGGRLRARRRRQRILTRLAALGQAYRPEGAAEFLAGVSMILRQAAVARFPREEVASLSGGEWIRFLDATGGNGRFREEIGEALGEGPYRPCVETDPDKVVELARAWLEKNL